MKGKREQYLVPALAFAIPAAVMLWVYAALGIAPFGDNTILVSDMSSQYVDFFCALKNGELFFSWSKSLGTGYIGVISYYVSSPLSLLTLLAPNEAMPAGLALLTVLKIGLAGLAFSVFARRRFPGSGISALVCAVCYALMSYNAAYSLCIMWLDGVIWLPLILLAVERILAGRGAGPYIAALTVCFISTWYISYMIGIFCVLYLGVRLAGLRPGQKALAGILGRFLGGAACALGLTAWLWLPTFLAMFSGKLNGVNFTDYGGLVLCNPVLLLGQLLPGRFGGIENAALPYLFCGTAAWVLALAHFLGRDSYEWEKVAERGVLLVLFLSMLFSPLDKAWHVFRMPNWFPFRYAFLFSFFLLYLAVQALPRVLEALKKRKRGLERGAALALAVFTVAELGWNARAVISGMQERYGSDSCQGYRDSYAATAQLVSASRLDAGPRFARLGSTADRGHNNPLAQGYPGITHYSSLYNYGVNRLLKKLGFAQSWYWCSYRGSTPVTDAVLDVGYVISRDGRPGYERVAQAGGMTLWKNPDTLPLAFLAAECGPELEGGGPFERQNNLLGGLLGREAAAFAPVADGTDNGAGETVFTLTGEGRPIYADLSAKGVTQVLVNGERVVSVSNDLLACVHCLGAPAPGEEWTVTVLHPDTYWEGTLWSFDREVLRGAAEELNNVEVTSVGKDGRVRLSASSGGDKTLVTTIPAEDGWTAYVDGEKAEMGTWLDTFLALDLPAGEHEVELRYTPPGLLPGLALGALSLAGLALAMVKKRKRR